MCMGRRGVKLEERVARGQVRGDWLLLFAERQRQREAEKHLRWTMAGPDSSYSSFEIHICWNAESDARIDPPTQTEYLRSGGAMILIFIVAGARAVSSFCMRSAMPGNMVEPPESTVLP